MYTPAIIFTAVLHRPEDPAIRGCVDRARRSCIAHVRGNGAVRMEAPLAQQIAGMVENSERSVAARFAEGGEEVPAAVMKERRCVDGGALEKRPFEGPVIGETSGAKQIHGSILLGLGNHIGLALMPENHGIRKMVGQIETA